MSKKVWIILSILLVISITISILFFTSKKTCIRTTDLENYKVESIYRISYISILNRKDIYYSNNIEILNDIELKFKDYDIEKNDNKLIVKYKNNKKYNYYSEIKRLKKQGYTCK